MATLNLRVIYDTDDNWRMEDMDNNEVWEMGHSPGSDGHVTATVDLIIELPEPTPPNVRVTVPSDAIATAKANVTVQKFD